MMVELSTPFMFVLNGPMDYITSWVAYSGMLPDHIHKLRFSSSIVIFVAPSRSWSAKNNICFQPWTFVTASKNFREHWRACSNETETSNKWKKARTRYVTVQIAGTVECQVCGVLSSVGIGCLCVFLLLPASYCPTAFYPRKCRSSHEQSFVKRKHLLPENPGMWFWEN